MLVSDFLPGLHYLYTRKVLHMNIEHKKTTLGDDSILYQKRDDSLGKKDISNLSTKDKAGYFKDYYLKIVLVIAAIAVGVIYLIYSTTIGRSNTAASVVFLNESYIYNPDGVSDALKEFLNIERKKDYVAVSNYDLDNYQENMAYVTQMTTGTVDVVICPKDYFESGCEGGFFADLGEVLPEEMYESLKDQLLEGRYAVTDDEGEVISYEDPLPYGISIQDSARYEEFGGALSDSVLCVIANSENTDNTLQVISWFTDVAVPASAAEAVPAE